LIPFKFPLLSQSGTDTLMTMGALLLLLTAIFYTVKKIKGPSKLVNELIQRTHSWWAIFFLCAIFLFLIKEVAFLGLILLSVFAFREMSRNIQLRDSDQDILKWCYAAIPVQFACAYVNYLMGFVLWIPVIFFIFISFALVAKQNTQNISRSMGVIHWLTMVTIFSFSHLAYFLSYPFPELLTGGDLLMFVILLTELNDVFQFTWGKLSGRRKIAPIVSPNKTIEGFLGGLISTMVLGYLLRFLCPLPVAKVAILSIFISVIGFFGDITLSAIKREMQVKDMSQAIPGHGGLMDRMDSLAFTSILFFYLVRLWSSHM
jgi:phosphatidate cytidylyltransferase